MHAVVRVPRKLAPDAVGGRSATLLAVNWPSGQSDADARSAEHGMSGTAVYVAVNGVHAGRMPCQRGNSPVYCSCGSTSVAVSHWQQAAVPVLPLSWAAVLKV